jgi:hypothetical protein
VFVILAVSRYDAAFPSIDDWRSLMSLQDRLETLRTRHANLETEIVKEISRPLPNPETLTDLKRQKLRIKDEIVQLERTH